MAIYMHISNKYGGRTGDYWIWGARKDIDEGKKLYRPSPPKRFNPNLEGMESELYDWGLFMYLLHKKNKKLFYLFTESIYQKIEKRERQQKWILWGGIGLFVLVLIYLTTL
jgi:hypothetical protein